MKFFWFLSLSFCCCYVSNAQQPGEVTDSSSDARQVAKPTNAVFTNFSGVVKELNKVLLQWDVDSTEDGDYFIIERATDGDRYETIGALRKTGGNNHYELTDAAPPNGADFYRIKYSGQGGRTLYSRTVQLNLSGEVDFKFYPNPVDKLFIIRTEHAVDIQVIDPQGSVRVAKRLQPGIQVVNVSNLERGIYVLRVADKESNKIISNQLIKN